MGPSRFFDLQVHTPADQRHGYANVGAKEPNAAFARSPIEAHANAGVEVMAVTDHNRVDWYPVLRAAGDELGVFVFPGLELPPTAAINAIDGVTIAHHCRRGLLQGVLRCQGASV